VEQSLERSFTLATMRLQLRTMPPDVLREQFLQLVDLYLQQKATIDRTQQELDKLEGTLSHLQMLYKGR
jgi:hypothetical protein